MSDERKKHEVDEFRAEETRWISDNIEWLERDYPGKWIAVQGSRLIAVGESAVEVVNAAKAKGVERPFLDVVRSKKAQNSVVIRSLRRWR